MDTLFLAPPNNEIEQQSRDPLLFFVLSGSNFNDKLLLHQLSERLGKGDEIKEHRHHMDYVIEGMIGTESVLKKKFLPDTFIVERKLST